MATNDLSVSVNRAQTVAINRTYRRLAGWKDTGAWLVIYDAPDCTVYVSALTASGTQYDIPDDVRRLTAPCQLRIAQYDQIAIATDDGVEGAYVNVNFEVITDGVVPVRDPRRCER